MEETKLLNQKGEIAQTLGLHEVAAQYFRAAHKRFVTLGIHDPLFEAHILKNLGFQLVNTGQHKKACHQYQAAIAILQRQSQDNDDIRSALEAIEEEYAIVCEGQAHMTKKHQSPVLSPDELIKLVDNTITACTVRTQQRNYWGDTLVAERASFEDADVIAFFDALIAIVREDTITITDNNPYHGYVITVLNEISGYLALQENESEPDTSDTESYDMSQPFALALDFDDEDEDDMPYPNTYDGGFTQEQIADDFSTHLIWHLCHRTFITAVIGSQTQYDDWLNRLESMQDWSTENREASEVITGLIEVMQGNIDLSVGKDNPHYDTLTRAQDDIIWTQRIMQHSITILTKGMHNAGDWLNTLRKSQTEEEKYHRYDRVEFLASIDQLIDEDIYEPLPEEQPFAMIWDYMANRIKAYRSGKTTDVSTIIERTLDALITPNRGKRMQWKRSLEKLIDYTVPYQSLKDDNQAQANAKINRPMRGFLVAVLAIMEDQPVRSMWSNPYQTDIEYVQQYLQDLPYLRARIALLNTTNPKDYIATNESLILSDRFIVLLQELISDTSDSDEQQRAIMLMNIIMYYKEAKQASLDEAFKPPALRLLKTAYHQEGGIEANVLENFQKGTYSPQFVQGLLGLYQDLGEDDFSSLLLDEDFPPTFIVMLSSLLRNMLDE